MMPNWWHDSPGMEFRSNSAQRAISAPVSSGVLPSTRSARLDEAGVVVTVNSDDPPLFGTTLTDEFLVLARDWGYDADGLQRIALNAVDAAFLSDQERANMRSVIRDGVRRHCGRSSISPLAEAASFLIPCHGDGAARRPRSAQYAARGFLAGDGPYHCLVELAGKWGQSGLDFLAACHRLPPFASAGVPMRAKFAA